MKTYTLELAVDFDTEEHYAVVKTILMRTAREVLATSMLIAGKRKPQVVLHSKDFFHGKEEIEVSADPE